MFRLFCFLHQLPRHLLSFFFFFFNDTATTEIYTLSLHDALPIFRQAAHLLGRPGGGGLRRIPPRRGYRLRAGVPDRSEEHTSELQSQSNLVCRLLLEKKKQNKRTLPPEASVTG